MELTPAQLRLIAAAQRRRAMEYERQYNAWHDGSATASGVQPISETRRRPAAWKQVGTVMFTILGVWIFIIAIVAVLITLIGWVL
jgi:hypothetical protein